MDLRMFYQKLRKIESQITDPHVMVVSLETSDGGKGGVMTEVKRETAAQLIVEGRAQIATAEEAAEFRESQLLAREVFQSGQPLTQFEMRSAQEAILDGLADKVRTLKG